MRKILLLSFIYFLSSCGEKGINDPSKRNENWVWWVDAKSGKGEWIPHSDETTVKSGNYTLFYSNGKIMKKGKLIDGEDRDTAFIYDLNESLIKYQIFEQDTTVYYYIKDGAYKDYFQKGTLSQEGIVKNHQIGEKWTSYFENGNIKWKKNTIENAELNINYYENGQMADSANKIDGKQSGRAKFWYENGQIKEISDWKMGVQDGIFKTYYENGQLSENTIWANGKREGKNETWYENGQREFIRTNVNGEIDGEALAWYSNGNYKHKCNFVNGAKNGLQTFYYENGNMECKYNYLNGIKNGEQINYYENGQPQSIANVVNNVQNGLTKFYDDKGKLIQTDTYNNGQLVHVEK